MVLSSQLISTRAYFEVWLAALWNSKLTKANVFKCNLESTCKDLIQKKIFYDLRATSHLLLGLVRILSMKAKYLLTDCNDTLTKVKIGFRPGKAVFQITRIENIRDEDIITIEDFIASDHQLPQLRPDSNIEIENFSINTSCFNEITLKDDLADTSCNDTDPVNESFGRSYSSLDKSLPGQNDTFGDEDKEYDIFDFLTNPNNEIYTVDFTLEPPFLKSSFAMRNSTPKAVAHRDKPVVETDGPALNETTLPPKEEVTVTIEPVAMNSILPKTVLKKRQKPVEDRVTRINEKNMRKQILNYSDLLIILNNDLFVGWKEKGVAAEMFHSPCSTMLNPHLRKVFTKRLTVKRFCPSEEREAMLHERPEDQNGLSTHSAQKLDTSTSETSHTMLGMMDYGNETFSSATEFEQDESKFIPSEDSTLAYPSCLAQNTQPPIRNAQSISRREDRANKQTTKLKKLLQILSIGKGSSVSLNVLCESSFRTQAANTFIGLLTLRKQKSINVHQTGPYEEIFIMPGPCFGPGINV